MIFYKLKQWTSRLVSIQGVSWWCPGNVPCAEIAKILSSLLFLVSWLCIHPPSCISPSLPFFLLMFSSCSVLFSTHGPMILQADQTTYSSLCTYCCLIKVIHFIQIVYRFKWVLFIYLLVFNFVQNLSLFLGGKLCLIELLRTLPKNKASTIESEAIANFTSFLF